MRAFLVDHKNKEDDLLEGKYAPISTFSSRINLTYRLGLIGPNIRSDLDYIRDIRNKFAHRYESLNFDEDEQVKAWCGNLKLCNKIHPPPSDLTKSSRHRFIHTVSVLALTLMIKGVRMKHIQEKINDM